jgi:hypothetical protein
MMQRREVNNQINREPAPSNTVRAPGEYQSCHNSLIFASRDMFAISEMRANGDEMKERGEEKKHIDDESSGV